MGRLIQSFAALIVFSASLFAAASNGPFWGTGGGGGGSGVSHVNPPTSDTAATDGVIACGQNAYGLATVNTTGGDCNVGAGIGTSKFSGISWTNCVTSSAVLTVNVIDDQAATTAVSVTEAIDFVCPATIDADCASAIYDAFVLALAAAGSSTTALYTAGTTTVGFTPGKQDIDLSTTSTLAACATASDGTDGIIDARFATKFRVPPGDGISQLGLEFGNTGSGISGTATTIYFYPAGSLSATISSGATALSANRDLVMSGGAAYLGNTTSLLCLDNGACAASGHGLGAGDVMVGQALEVDGALYADSNITLTSPNRVEYNGASSGTYTYGDATYVYTQTPTASFRVGATSLFANNTTSSIIQGNADNIRFIQYTATATTPGDVVASTTHRGYNGSATRELFTITTYADDSTPASEESHTAFNVYENGSDTEYLKLDGSDAVQGIVASKPIFAANGSAAAPSYSFSSDKNTGVFWVSDGIYAFVGNTNEAFRVESSTTTFTGAVRGGSTSGSIFSRMRRSLTTTTSGSVNPAISDTSGLYSNYGGTAEVTYTIPNALTAGAYWKFVCSDADGIQIDIGVGNTVYAGETNVTDCMYSTAIGSTADCTIMGSNFVICDMTGTWTIDGGGC